MNKIPAEVLNVIASYLRPTLYNGVHSQTLANLALTNHTWHTVAEIQLYHTVDLEGVDELRSFLYAILRKPSRRILVRSVTLGWDEFNDTPAYGRIETGRLTEKECEEEIARIEADDVVIGLAMTEGRRRDLPFSVYLSEFGGIADAFIAFMFHFLPAPQHFELRINNLPRVIAACFPSHLPGNDGYVPPAMIQSLRSFKITHLKKDGMEFVAVPPVHILQSFRLPSLRDLTIYHVGGEQVWRISSPLIEYIRGLSTVTRLQISNAGVPDGALLAKLLTIPIQLEVLELTHVSMILPDWDPEQFERFGDGIRTLTHLRRLEIVDWSAEPTDWVDVGTLGSLRELASLTHVHVRAPLLLGNWTEGAEDGPRLEEVLPKGLLELDLDQDERWADPQERGRLIEFVRKSKLKKLWVLPDTDGEIAAACAEVGTQLNSQLHQQSLMGWRWEHM